MADKRANPTPRAEGMANIVAATMRLLEQRSPAEITLRDVAKQSGHGHRLIVEWFGGKGGLYAAVFQQIFLDLARTGELFYSDFATRPEVRVAVRVVNYMQMHHSDFVQQVRNTFVLDAVQVQLMKAHRLSPEQASLAARRLIVQTMGLAVFSELLNLTDDEVIAMTQDEVRSTTGGVMADNPKRA